MTERDWLILIVVGVGLGGAWGWVALRRSSLLESRWEQTAFFAAMAAAATAVYVISSWLQIRADEALQPPVRALLASGTLLDPEGDCGNHVLAEYPSPDQRQKLVVFERSCGATTGFSTQASLVPDVEGLAPGGGNVFAADTNHGAAPEGPGGGPQVEGYWLSNMHVVIRHHPAARVFKRVKTHDGVDVEFLADLWAGPG